MKLLEVNRVVCMPPPVKDVHEGHRQQVRRYPAYIAVQRFRGRRRGGADNRERGPENSIGTQPALILRAVKVDQRLVDLGLRTRVPSRDRVRDFAIDRVHRPPDPFTEKTSGIAIAELHCLIRAR
jgi:hypothetical protein